MDDYIKGTRYVVPIPRGVSLPSLHILVAECASIDVFGLFRETSYGETVKTGVLVYDRKAEAPKDFASTDELPQRENVYFGIAYEQENRFRPSSPLSITLCGRVVNDKLVDDVNAELARLAEIQSARRSPARRPR